jgi:phenylpyruvate tautomerase PptA (4-oxalocrotonate tautomerase family)
MPQVTISILKGKSPEYIKAIADGLNSAVIKTLRFPDDDRYQIIHQLDSEGLLYLLCSHNLKNNNTVNFI